MWGHLVLKKNVLDVVNYRGFFAEGNRGFTKVSTGGIKARFWSKDGGWKDIDLETQSINRL